MAIPVVLNNGSYLLPITEPVLPVTDYLAHYKADSSTKISHSGNDTLVTNWQSEEDSTWMSFSPSSTTITGSEVKFQASMATLNSKPAVRFGTAGGTIGANYVSNIANISQTALTIFLVAQNNELTGVANQRVINSSAGNILIIGAWQGGAGAKPVIYRNGTFLIDNPDVTWPDIDAPYVLAMSGGDAVSSYQTLNGVSLGVSTTKSTSNLGQLNIGDGFGPERIAHYVAEIIIYPRKLTSLEIDDVNNYLQTKYAISDYTP